MNISVRCEGSLCLSLTADWIS